MTPENKPQDPEIKQQDKAKKKKKKIKERQDMWNALKDYGLFCKLTLENDIKGKMTCKCCMADYLKANCKEQANIDVNAFGLNVCSRSSAFASLLTVECLSGKHSFVIEPPRRKEDNDASETEDKELPKKKRGRPPSTNRIRDYAINYQAFLLTQVLGNGITSLDTTMGLLGLGPHSGSHHEWMYIGHELGKAEQKRADSMQLRNL